ncbi:MAG TPA: MoxR family ATPase [Candidatus Hydrogenedentes bacterium]|nr:MoxR family ATPase [Candidatus Hydrogenedentota bacterium]
MGASELQFNGTERYYLDPELKAIVNMALAMEKPLLLTGEAGTGKTQLAMEVARALALPTEVLRAKSTIKGEEACYVQDTVLRLNDARFGSGETGRAVDNFFDYVIWGPIGRAFRADSKVMLLLDEIDKTESDVQDNLLDILEDCEFTIREVNTTIKATIRPAIFLTSNAKRELSDPFLRRCFCHHIAFPSPEQMHEILKLHFPKTSAKLMETAIAIFYELRERGFEKPPATSELINWIGALERSGQLPDAKNPPLIGVLLKRAGDIATYRDSGKGRRFL